MNGPYSPKAPSREEVDALEGETVIEFGTDWCGHCRAAQPLIEQTLATRPGVRHIKVEDGKGRVLGRTFRVKLWPTLIFMRQGQEVARVVRPTDVGDISQALARLN